MPHRIWVGKFRATSFNKIGLRHKLPGQDWQAPYKDHIIPLSDPQTTANGKRYARGELIQPQEFAECSAVYDAVRFARQKQFSRAGIGYIVDKQVKEVLEPFDLGPGGLFPYTIYQADEVTPTNEQWWMLGMGAQKRSFCPDKSAHPDLECLFDGKGQKDSLYNIAIPPGDDVLAFSSAALEGSDIWHEPELAISFCFSDRLGQALLDADLSHWFDLQTARIVN
jgi:hypothetical protein